MKNLFTIIFLTVTVSSAFAQNPMPNSSFENWYTASNDYLNPTGCDTAWFNNSNYDHGDYASQSVFRSNNAHSGNYALEISDAPDAQNTSYYYGGYMTFIFPVSFQPMSFSGWWIVNEGISFLTSGNIKVSIDDSVTGHYLGGGTVTTPGNAESWSSYEQFSSGINYDSTAKKYLCYVVMTLDDGEVDATPNMIFDDIAISATSGLSVIIGKSNSDLEVYPNPVVNKAEIVYNLKNSGNVTVTLTDVMGRIVKTIKNEFDVPGDYVLNTDLSDVSAGMYLCRLSTPDGNQVKKVMITR